MLNIGQRTVEFEKISNNNYKNTFLPQLIHKHNFLQKNKGFQQQKEIKEYIIILKHSYILQDLPKHKNIQTKIRLITLDQITENEPADYDDIDNSVSLTTTLHPSSYVQKILDLEIANYAKRGITITTYVVKTSYSALVSKIL